MRKIYAVGDIHGELCMLHKALELIEDDGGPEASIVFLGDYTDRGPDSCKVLDLLIQGRDTGRNWIFLKGNHDRMFEWFLETPSRGDPYLFFDLSWLHDRLGGKNTLQSYGLDFTTRHRLSTLHSDTLKVVPKAHYIFLAGCQLSYETEDLFFCHAGIRPGIDLHAQNEEDLLWIRAEFHAHLTSHPKMIVHGHSPVDEACHYGNRINLDSGAGYGGPLAAAVFEAGACYVLTPMGRKEIFPINGA